MQPHIMPAKTNISFTGPHYSSDCTNKKSLQRVITEEGRAQLSYVLEIQGSVCQLGSYLWFCVIFYLAQSLNLTLGFWHRKVSGGLGDAN